MNKFKVPIKNALFMYSYIWDKVDCSDFTNLSDNDDFYSSNIYAELFLINIKKILQKGLYKEYIEKIDELSVVKGSINISETVNKQSKKIGKIICNYDEFEENNMFNKILKYVAIKLYKMSDISQINKKKLNKVILYLNQVDFVEINKLTFKNIRFNRQNLHYYFMIKICELIVNARMLDEGKGKYKFYDLFNTDENMNQIFELFIYKFYQHELKKDFNIKYQTVLNWNLGGENISLLPIMKLDVLLKSTSETIIIDTKYYKNYLVENNYDQKKLRSGHIYQMISYMNNINCNNYLRGILLYPKPFDEDNIFETYDVKVVNNDSVKDAKIQFATIDLSVDWKIIKDNLLNIIKI